MRETMTQFNVHAHDQAIGAGLIFLFPVVAVVWLGWEASASFALGVITTLAAAVLVGKEGG
jgi:uncharacterized membrane protein